MFPILKTKYKIEFLKNLLEYSGFTVLCFRCTESESFIYIYMYEKMLVAQLCPTLSDPMDCSPPGSSVHGILQAEIVEWVAIPYPGYLPCPMIEPMFLTLLSEPPGKPIYIHVCVYIHSFSGSFPT